MNRLVRFAALGGALSLVAATTSTPIDVWLRTSWNTTNFLPEVLETIAIEDPAVFFPLLDLLVHPRMLGDDPEKHSPEDIYAETLSTMKMAFVLREPGAMASFERGLALRVASPKIEAFLSYYQGRYGHLPLDPSCGSWVDWYGQRLCRAEDVAAAVGYECPKWRTFRGASVCDGDFTKSDKPYNLENPLPPTSLPFDHAHPTPTGSGERPRRTAVLYAAVDSPNFYGLHSTLLHLADRADVRYVFRYAPLVTRDGDSRAYLTGYGVALDLKKTDYLALDDRRKMQSRASSDQVVLSDTPESDVAEDPILAMLPEDTRPASESGKPLTEEELTALGFKVSQLILDSSEPLNALKRISQSFPQYASAISHRYNQTDDVVLAIGSNMQMVKSGMNLVWLNGKLVKESDMQPFALLNRMRKERRLITSLTANPATGLTRSQAIQVLTHSALTQASPHQVLEGMFDASDRPEGEGLILWLNDLEKDARYAAWPSTLEHLMKPSYGGQLPAVSRNMWNVIVALDITQSHSVATLNMISGITQRGIPVRFGIVPLVSSPEAEPIVRFFYYLTENFDVPDAIKYYTKAADPRRPTISLDALREVYDIIRTTEETRGPNVWEDFDDVTMDEEDTNAVIKRLGKYSRRLALDQGFKGGHMFVNGKYGALTDDWLRSLQSDLGQQYRFIRESIIAGDLAESEDLDLSNYFYDLPTTAKGRNPYIYASSDSLKIIPTTDLPLPTGFIQPPGAKNVPLSMWVVGDLETEAGLELVKEGLSAMSDGSSFRLSCVHAAPESAAESPRAAAALMDVLFSEASATPADVLGLLGKMFDEKTDQKALLQKIWGDITIDSMKKLEARGRLIMNKIGFQEGDIGIIVNGRVLGPLPKGAFKAEDFHTLASYERNKRVAPVQEALDAVLSAESSDDERKPDWDKLTAISSIILADQLPEPGMDMPPTARGKPYLALESEHASFSFGNNETAIYHFGVILNPMSETAQKLSSLLEWLADDQLVHVTVYLNPPHEVKEMPLKRFYQYNLQKKVEFAEDHDLKQPKVEFTGLPDEPIYTLAMDVPQSWLVRPQESVHDLDNIQLAGEERIQAGFSLDYLVIEGHARDRVNAAPRGLQLQLTSEGAPVADTLVVANLGYFQLKSKPGVYELEIRPGRGREIFEMTSAGNQGWESPSVDEAGVAITITSFEGITLYPTFKRKEGMDNEDVLASGDEGSGIFGNIADRVGSLFGSSKPKPAGEVAKKQADINIFTVASGLLYERFASIMILSVLKNTDKTVKFWFIENFLSPSFLEFIPHFAKEYNFDYELVTYKWPSWLRMPTEKQRIIWGYKILFLDVLFPMDLKKVIFVDADQIVRADLHELVTLDLHGAPYGYTPMGDDSEDMDGFRFWKQGYWKEALAGKPYHISALYVVDLVRFRQIAAGDRLRGQYQGLSADPNSLANLDQDLPNNMQKEVPIFSLPEDWLWCETWCSKDRLHRAKTIDLCQNPKTKEPKLSRARQIPEWEKYDAEIAAFARKLAGSGRIHSSAAVENVDALAGEPAKASPKGDDKVAGTGSHDEL